MSLSNPQTRYLQIPLISKVLEMNSFAAVRPYRKTAIRVERQIMDGKIIFHNYGHGASGISVSPATAFQTVQLVDKESSIKQIAVMGAGIAGLTSALQLAERGYKVNVYAKIIPNKNEKQNSFLCTSQVAGGFWHPTSYNEKDLQQKSKRAVRAYEIYSNWFKKFKGLSQCMAYIEYSQQKYDIQIPKSLGIDKKIVKAYFSKKSDKYKILMEFKTFKISIPTFLQELIQQCKRKGVKFVEHTFHSNEDILKLKEQHIINCLGLSSKQFFKDQQCHGLKGHHVYFKNPLGVDYILQLKHQGVPVCFYCHKDQVILGQIKQQKEDIEVDRKIVQKLYKNFQNFQKYYTSPNPKL